MLAHYIIEVAALAVVAALFWCGLIKEMEGSVNRSAGR